jgi:Flp pilus assembly protein TadD
VILLLAHLALAATAPKPAETAPDFQDPRERVAVQMQIVQGLIDSGVPEQALKTIAEMRAQGVHEVRLDVLQARAMHLAGMSTDAQEVLKKHLKRHPRDAEAWALLGLVHADAQRLDEAVAALERARRIDPKNPGILNNLGYVHMAHGDLERAVELFRASLAADPSQARTRNNLGFALARLERDAEAMEAFRAANDEADARYNMGVACEMRNDRAGAITQYRAAIDARPGHLGATAALKRLLTEDSP